MPATTVDTDFLDEHRRSGEHADGYSCEWCGGDDNLPMTEAPKIIKADGSHETFDRMRLFASLERAGAGAHTADRIAHTIAGGVMPGMSSREIYARAFALMRKESRPVAARYALRRALLELGPTGHPFEDFISHLYRAEGWHVETRKMIKGHCVMHEVDFYASHPEQNTFLAGELKYHNDPNYKTDLKVALYVKSRFDDIFACDNEKRSCPIDRGILVTNTKFTSEAVAYAECAGVELLGWGYPEHDSLFMRMTRAKIYPLTVLTRFTRTEKRLLIENGSIAVDEILRERRRLDVLHLTPERIGEIIAEAEGLLSLPVVSHGTVSVW